MERARRGRRQNLAASHKLQSQGGDATRSGPGFPFEPLQTASRRDFFAQVFKLCLNHLIVPELRLTYKDPDAPKVLLWTARDFSDAEEADGEVFSDLVFRKYA